MTKTRPIPILLRVEDRTIMKKGEEEQIYRDPWAVEIGSLLQIHISSCRFFLNRRISPLKKHIFIGEAAFSILLLMLMTPFGCY
jgi:hypothetical protein